MRIIDADALIESIKHGLWDWETINGIESRTVLEQTIQDIKNEPTIDAEPVRHGHWIYFEQDNMFGCSKCARWMPRNNYLYCPWCGARMNEVNDE